MADGQTKVRLAGSHQVDGLWIAVSEGLERACRKTGGDLTSDYLWSETRSGRAFLVVISRREEVIGASVWQFQAWSSGRKLRCLALFGEDMADWLDQHRKLTEEMARAGGATALVTEGRRGFQRLFPEARELRRLYELDLT